MIQPYRRPAGEVPTAWPAEAPAGAAAGASSPSLTRHDPSGAHHGTVRMLLARVAAPVWHRLGGGAQWAVLWATQPKFLVGVAGVVFDDQDRVLLLRARFWPRDSWGLPAGYVKHGERLEGALARELREETGYQIDDVTLLRVVSGYRWRMEVILTARLAGGQRRIDSGEVLEARFHALDALPPGLLASHVRHIEAAVRHRLAGRSS
ncbi:MAG: NUDIX domain-containing protein [Candidatus Dormiibacterota bacterium]